MRKCEVRFSSWSHSWEMPENLTLNLLLAALISRTSWVKIIYDLTVCHSLTKRLYLMKKINHGFPKKLKIELPYDSAIPLLGIHLKETLIWKDICTPVYTEALLAITKTCNHPKWSRRDERIKKMWYIYIYNVCIYVYVCLYYYIYIYIILFSHKKEWNNATFSNIGGHRDYHTKWNKS